MFLTSLLSSISFWGRFFPPPSAPSNKYPSPPSPMDGLYASLELVCQWSARYQVDGSHNHDHSMEVLFWLIQILEKTPEDRRDPAIILTAMHGVILHDVLDEKYMDRVSIDQYRASLYQHLLLVLPHPDDAVTLLYVMEGISYRKVVRTEGICYPDWIPDAGKWYDIYHWIRQADLLASYNIARMVEFRMRTVLYEERETMWSTIVEDVHSLYHQRIARLLERGLFVHDEAREIAEPLAYIAGIKIQLLSFQDHNIPLDIFRIVHHLEWTFLRSRILDLLGGDRIVAV